MIGDHVAQPRHTYIDASYSFGMRAELHHVSINVTDVDRSLSFYRDLLGMRQLERPAFGFDGAWLDAGGERQVHLIAAPVPPDIGQHVALRVTDLDAALVELVAAGYAVGAPKDVPGTSIRQVHVADPDGNRVELTEIS